jgi:hypothetical protein
MVIIRMGDVMSDRAWLRVGRGDAKAELERVVRALKRRWQHRYDYRIEPVEATDQQEKGYNLLIRHV